MSSVSENEIFESFSREDTYNFAKALGEKAEPGQVFCLRGDLGVGKTVFAQGFGGGVGVTEPMSSPMMFTESVMWTSLRKPVSMNMSEATE